MKTIECKCAFCQKCFDKPLNEYKRRIKLNSKFYCSRSCSGRGNFTNFGDKINHIPPHNKNKANPFKYYLRNCLKRGKECDIDLHYLENLWNVQGGCCAYTGVNLILNTHSYRYPDIRHTASLDRIDNTKGYIKNNVQFICTAINYMKHTLTNEQTIEFLHTISKNIINFR